MSITVIGIETKPSFHVGNTIATQGMSRLIAEHQPQITECLRRHIRGDWGTVCEEDSKMNDWAAEQLEKGENNRVLSAYEIDGTKFWIITEGDSANRVTTLLLPSEY